MVRSARIEAIFRAGFNFFFVKMFHSVRHMATSKSYADVWRLPESTRRELVSETRAYLDGMVEGVPPYKEFKQWLRMGKSNYYPFLLNALQTMKKSMCMSNRHAVFDINRSNVLFWVKGHPDFPEEVNRYNMRLNIAAAFGNHRAINGQIVKCMDDAKRTGLPKFLLTFVGILTINADGKKTTGHATLLLFDLVNRHQVFFDPSGWEDDVKPFLEAPLIPGFEPVPVSECAFTERIRTPTGYALQHKYETPEYKGVCGIMCMLVFQLCSRFNYYHMRNMAEILVDAYPELEDRRRLIGRFVRLYRSSSAELVNRAFPAVEGAPCLSFMPRTRTLCRAPSCGPATVAVASADATKQKKRRVVRRPNDIRTYCDLHRAMFVADTPFAESHPPSCQKRMLPRDWSWRKQGSAPEKYEVD